MTNEQIIFMESQRLMNEGIIGNTGRKFTATVKNADGEDEVMEVFEPEAIHTYAGWKARGYQVQKGAKAVAQFPIWTTFTKKAKSEDEEDTTKLYMKKASWFSFSQVQEAGGGN